MYDGIIILGPTATGKTKFSIELARKLNTEIINADSMYIYDKLDIGTAKPTKEEMENIKHHLIGFVSPNDSFNVSDYRDNVRKTLKTHFQNKIPIFVGGTGFYIESLIKPFSYGEVEKNPKIRNDLEKELQDYGKDYLYDKLQKLDFETAIKLHKNDTYRIIRALELVLSGKKKSELYNNEEVIIKKPLLIGFNYDRDILYKNINKRVDIMFDKGLIDEVSYLYNDLKLSPRENQSMKGIGYKELCDYFDDLITLDTAKELIKQHTRNYAKRQITWFKRYDNIHWFNPIEDMNILDKILEILNNE